MGKATKAEKKIAYDAKLCQLIDEYTQSPCSLTMICNECENEDGFSEEEDGFVYCKLCCSRVEVIITTAVEADLVGDEIDGIFQRKYLQVMDSSTRENGSAIANKRKKRELEYPAASLTYQDRIGAPTARDKGKKKHVYNLGNAPVAQENLPSPIVMRSKTKSKIQED